MTTQGTPAAGAQTTDSTSGSDPFFLSAAFASFLLSVALFFLFDPLKGIFVGLWVPSILALWVGVRLSTLVAGQEGGSQ